MDRSSGDGCRGPFPPVGGAERPHSGLEIHGVAKGLDGHDVVDSSCQIVERARDGELIGAVNAPPSARSRQSAHGSPVHRGGGCGRNGPRRPCPGLRPRWQVICRRRFWETWVRKDGFGHHRSRSAPGHSGPSREGSRRPESSFRWAQVVIIVAIWQVVGWECAPTGPARRTMKESSPIRIGRAMRNVSFGPADGFQDRSRVQRSVRSRL